MALAPAVVGSFTVKNGVGLSLVFGMVTIPVLVLASFLGMLPEKVPQYVRTIACAVLAALMLIPARLLAGGIAPNLFDSLGLYFSAVAVNTVWLVRAPLCQEKKPQWAFCEGICHTIGFSICVLSVSALRNFWPMAPSGETNCPVGEISGSGLCILQGLSQSAWRRLFCAGALTEDMMSRPWPGGRKRNGGLSGEHTNWHFFAAFNNACAAECGFFQSAGYYFFADTSRWPKKSLAVWADVNRGHNNCFCTCNAC